MVIAPFQKTAETPKINKDEKKITKSVVLKLRLTRMISELLLEIGNMVELTGYALKDIFKFR